jgi:metal-sulfur cluster biosynthetic enzyme
LIRDVEIINGTGHIKMILTTPFCPYGPAMIEMTKAKATEGLDMPVTIEMPTQLWLRACLPPPSLA